MVDLARRKGWVGEGGQVEPLGGLLALVDRPWPGERMGRNASAGESSWQRVDGAWWSGPEAVDFASREKGFGAGGAS